MPYVLYLLFIASMMYGLDSMRSAALDKVIADIERNRTEQLKSPMALQDNVLKEKINTKHDEIIREVKECVNRGKRIKDSIVDRKLNEWSAAQVKMLESGKAKAASDLENKLSFLRWLINDADNQSEPAYVVLF